MVKSTSKKRKAQNSQNGVRDQVQPVHAHARGTSAGISDHDAATRPSKRPRVGSTAEIQSDVRLELKTSTDAITTLVKDDKVSFLPAHLKFLLARHDFVYVSVISSSKMRSKVASVLGHLTSIDDDSSSQKSKVVVIRSNAAPASKMISIIEIVKQELANDKVQVYQYCHLEGITRPLPKQRKPRVGDTAEPVNEDAQANVPSRNDDSDDSYEEMALPQKPELSPPLASEKLRNMPILTIYLSRTRLPDLKGLCG